jgi:hypothetical protein
MILCQVLNVSFLHATTLYHTCCTSSIHTYRTSSNHTFLTPQLVQVDILLAQDQEEQEGSGHGYDLMCEIMGDLMSFSPFSGGR